MGLPCEHSLEENEAVIRKGLSNFVEVGMALREIRDSRQYVTAGFDRFEDYCRERWDMPKTTATNAIGSSAVVVAIATTDSEPPSSEWVARPLLKLLNEDGPESVRERLAWVALQ